MHVAAGAGQVDAVRTLAQLGADLEAHDVHGFSPLYMAAGEGHCDVLRVLVEEVRALACPETREWSRFEAADASPCMPQETQSVLAHSLRPKLSRRDAATGLSQATSLYLPGSPSAPAPSLALPAAIRLGAERVKRVELVLQGADVNRSTVDFMHKVVYILPAYVSMQSSGGRIPPDAVPMRRVWPRRKPAKGSYLQRTRALLHLGNNRALHVDGSSALHVAAPRRYTWRLLGAARGGVLRALGGAAHTGGTGR